MPLKKKARKLWQRIWRERRFIKGICQNCQLPVYKDKTRCFKHLLYHARKQKEWRNRHDINNKNTMHIMQEANSNMVNDAR
jgi:hypothetical protein